MVEETELMKPDELGDEPEGTVVEEEPGEGRLEELVGPGMVVGGAVEAGTEVTVPGLMEDGDAVVGAAASAARDANPKLMLISGVREFKGDIYQLAAGQCQTQHRRF
jgi:hypothetical protein